MATSHPAIITGEEEDSVANPPGGPTHEPEPLGYRIEPSGKLVLVPLPEEVRARRQTAWIAFLDAIESRPPDPDFMLERPMNVPPEDRNLFEDV